MTDEQLLELMHPQPSVVVRSLKDDPSYVKCPRCWHYHSVRINYDSLCDCCQLVILREHPDHESAPHIKSNIEQQRIKWSATNSVNKV
jgi:hypothetical protein